MLPIFWNVVFVLNEIIDIAYVVTNLSLFQTI